MKHLLAMTAYVTTVVLFILMELCLMAGACVLVYLACRWLYKLSS